MFARWLALHALIAARLLALILMFAPAWSCPAAAQGKTVTIYVGNPVGGGYDLYGRLVARHLGRHLPGNPSVIVANMPGASSITCANFLYNAAPKDGTALGILTQTFEEEQVFGSAGVQFDAARFNWVGRISSNTEMAYVWHTVPVKTIDDLKTRETLFAAANASTFVYPLLLNSMIGTRFKLIRGYPGTQETHLAMQRGEIEGATSSLNTVKIMTEDWLGTGKIKVLVQYGLERHPELANVPAVAELGRTPDDKAILTFFAKSAAIGRSVIVPPDMPADRLAVVRTAFDATMTDPQFLADAQRLRTDINPMPGAQLQELIKNSVRLSDDERERARAVRSGF
jgi:tripartite-type tricarboxylate transporter receptor subunit TctC